MKTCDHGHGRIETRTAKVVSVRAGISFPDATQAVQVVHRHRHRTGRWRTQTTYVVTSLAAHQASPADLGDAVFDEDHSQIRTSNGPRIMASLRNLAIAVLRLTDTTNIAAALRHHAHRPDRPLSTITTC